VLGRDDIGALAPGMAADLVAFDLGALDHAGAHHDPVAALVFCTPARAALSVINGRIVVREGRLLTLEERAHAALHRAAARRLAE
jgi:cytosine/adenosine deaminase-related metal-dependent hydrolase